MAIRKAPLRFRHEERELSSQNTSFDSAILYNKPVPYIFPPLALLVNKRETNLLYF